MAKSKKQKIHALKKKNVAPNPTTVEWTPETVKEDMSNYINHLLKQEGDKMHTVATHLTNVYRGLEGVISSEFGRTPPKARLFLQEYSDKFLLCSGVAVMVKRFGQRYKLLVARPGIVGEVIGDPFAKQIKTIDFPTERNIDSHIWLDLDDIQKGEDHRLSTILFGDIIYFVGKSSLYRGKVSNKVRARAGKYGLTNIRIVGAYSATNRGVLYEAKMTYRLNHKNSIGIMEYSKKTQRYVPIKALANSLPQRLANEEKFAQIFDERGGEYLLNSFFLVQVISSVPDFKKKLSDYNKKYPEHKVLENYDW